VLAEALGHRITAVASPYDPEQVGELFTSLAAAGVARVVAAFPDWRERVTPAIAQFAEQGEAMTATEYLRTIDDVLELRWRLADQLDRFDLFLTPTVAGPLWPKSEPYSPTIAGQAAAPRAAAIYTTFANLGGLAAISIPAGSSRDGHPIGVQLVGPIGSEELLLDLTAAFERVRPWPVLAPG
jgi:aspartyl-tRNA(Asn)/glutamyl-tRNA(Gln) amidotransferase subunit A